MPELKVGSTVWIDGNPHTICGETRVSWQIKINMWDRRAVTFPKRPDDPSRIITSEYRRGFGGSRVWLTKKEWDDEVWRRQHQYNISQMVGGCSVDLLRKIAELIGYKETK